MTDASRQLLATIEDALTKTLDRRLPGIAEDLAELLAEQQETNGTNGGTVGGEMIDAAEVARRFGVSRKYVYEHSAELGAIRLGDGPKARLRFDPAEVDDTLGAGRTKPDAASAAPAVRRRLSSSTVDLLPIKGPQ